MEAARLPDELDAGPLVLRRSRDEHTDAAVAAVRESIAELRPWMAWAGGEVGAAEREFISQSGPRFDEGREFAFGIFDRAGGAVLGGCGAHRTHGPHAAEIGY